MQKNRITYPTGRQAVADDGVLAGRELESDAELIALGWLKPTDLFEGDELPAIYPEDDDQERADLLSARHAEREGKRKAERDAWLAIFPEDRTAFELATDFGRIGGQAATEIQPDVESTVGAQTNPYRQPDIAGDGDTFDAIPRRGQYACLYIGRAKARVVQSARGGSYRIDLPCEDTEGDCPPCRQHWIDSAADRLLHGLVGDTQLAITATGCQTPEKGQKLITAIGRQLGPVRRAQVLTRTMDYTYIAHIIVTGAMPLASVLARIAARAGVSIEYRPVSVDDFKALLYSRTKLDLARCPVRFLHWPTAAAAGAATNVYGHNDGYVATATDARNIPPMRLTRRSNLKIPESQRVRIRENEAADNADIWLTGNALDLVELLNLRNARRAGVRSKNDWLACIASGTYDGPKALIRDLAAVLDDDGLVSFTARKAMRRAATYLTEKG